MTSRGVKPEKTKLDMPIDETQKDKDKDAEKCLPKPPCGYPNPPGPPSIEQLPELGAPEEEDENPSEEPAPAARNPNVLIFLVDNLGYGELGCYGSGGILRGAATPRIDRFAAEGIRLLNFAPEAQCTPSRAALMTGRMAIRSGCTSIPLLLPGGLVIWERTLGYQLARAGYNTTCLGKWHIGETPGRWPTNHGFHSFYGPARSYDEALWEKDPSYNAERDGMAMMYEAEDVKVLPKATPVAAVLAHGVPKMVHQLTVELKRNLGDELVRRAKKFIDKSVAENKPFFCYFNEPLLHLPCWPSDRFKGHTGNGDWADCLADLDNRFGEMLDFLDEKGLADNTIVILCGDNGPEEFLNHRGHPGPWVGSYFTATEASLRTPCMIRYPGHVPPGRVSNEIVHITDLFTTTLGWCNARVPRDRFIDGKDQRAFFEGKDEHSAREGFLFFNGDVLYGVKWQNFKLLLYRQNYLDSPALKLATPHLINLLVDPQERETYHQPWLHTWVVHHFALEILRFATSVNMQQNVPKGAPLDYKPGDVFTPEPDPSGLMSVEGWGM